MKLKAVIFDMDGVIVNTVPLHFKAWKKMFGEYGKKFTFRDYKAKVDGIPRIDGARAILTGLGRGELEKAANRKNKYFLHFIKKDDIKVYKDTLSLIVNIRKAGIKTAVISSSKNCREILKRTRLLEYFDVVITGNDIKRGKPHPDIFLAAAKKLRTGPGGCIVVEDAVLGIEAARRARMKSIGIDRYNEPKRLRKADIVVSGLIKIGLSKLKELIPG